MTESVRASRAWVQISLTVGGFVLPDGSYRTQPHTDSRVCGPKGPEHLRFLGSKAFKALADQGYTPQISEIKSADEQLRGQSQINALLLAAVRKYWLWQAHRENKQALALVEALMAETLERRLDEAFGVIRTELERNELLSQRVQELERDISEAFWVEEEIRLERDHYERLFRE